MRIAACRKYVMSVTLAELPVIYCNILNVNLVVMEFGGMVGGFIQYDAIFRSLIVSRRVAWYYSFKQVLGKRDASRRRCVVCLAQVVGMTQLEGAAITCRIPRGLGRVKQRRLKFQLPDWCCQCMDVLLIAYRVVVLPLFERSSDILLR